MQLFASSVTQAAETFLHAGYISAQPPAMAMEYPMLQDTADTGYAVTLEGALRLSEAASQQAAVTAGPVWFETLGGALPAVAGAVGIAALAWWAIRHRPAWMPRPVPALGTLALAVGLMVACVGNPWQDVPPEDFEDPDAATELLMQALVADTVVAHHGDAGTVTGLGQLDGEVGLPVDELSDAQQYAIDSYGRDGWGNDFAFTHLGEGQYELTSAGPDGELDTDDDVVLAIDATDIAPDQRTYYLLERDGDLWLFIRNPPASLSNEWDSAAEGEVAFDDRFFGIPLTEEFLGQHEDSYGELSGTDWATALAEIRAFYDSMTTTDDPVVVQIYDRAIAS